MSIPLMRYIGRSPRRQSRTAKWQAEVTAGHVEERLLNCSILLNFHRRKRELAVRGWFKKLWLALGVLFCCAMLLVLPYDLYTAWKSHEIYVGLWFYGSVDAPGWASYETHPGAFWCALSIDIISILVLMVLAVFLVWQTRNERSVWRKRKSRPPMDDAIRQSTFEQ